MTQAIGYIRVSTDDQKASLEVQTERIINYCKFQELTLSEIIIDEDVSGFTAFNKRPGGSKATSLLNAGTIKTIIAIKPDRLFRNTIDGLTTVALWNDQDIDLHIIDMGGASFTTKTAIGKLIFTQLISIAQFERDNTGERIKAVLNHKKENNKAYTGKILGFNNISGALVPNTSEQATISTIMSLRDQKWAPNKISKYLNDHQYKSKTGGQFYPSTIQAILKNPIYKQD